MKTVDILNQACQNCGEPLNPELEEEIFCEECKVNIAFEQTLMLFRAVPYLRIKTEESLKRAFEKYGKKQR